MFLTWARSSPVATGIRCCPRCRRRGVAIASDVPCRRMTICHTLTVSAPDRRLVSPELSVASAMMLCLPFRERRRELPVAGRVGHHDADDDVAIDDRDQAARGRLAREDPRGVLRRAGRRAAADLELERRRRRADVPRRVHRDGREVVGPVRDRGRGGSVVVTPVALAVGVGRTQQGPAEVDLHAVVGRGRPDDRQRLLACQAERPLPVPVVPG